MDCHAQADNETDIFSSTKHLWSSITTRVPKCTLLWYGSSRDKWRLGRRWKLSVASHLLSLVLKFPLMCESLKHSLLMQRYLWKLCVIRRKKRGVQSSPEFFTAASGERFLGTETQDSYGLHFAGSSRISQVTPALLPASQDMEHSEAGGTS